MPGFIANHLWQSSLFAVAVWLAALALRRNHARIRYWLWLAASVKFALPFSLLLSLGERVEAPITPAAVPAVPVQQLSLSIEPVTTFYASSPAASHPNLLAALLAIWVAGALTVLARWLLNWRRMSRVAHRARPVAADFPIPLLASASTIEPGIFGLFRPVLLLPEGLAAKLDSEQLDAILAHELCHVRYHDNLTAALHMVVEAVFWFHPLVWWIGRRMLDERERACDEAVLSEGKRRDAYAQGILNVCRFYVQSPLPCASGVTGADLKRRITEIMTGRLSARMTGARKAMLAAAAAIAVLLPLAIGILRAQTLPPPPAYGYEVVSIRPAAPGEMGSRFGPGPQGGMRATNINVMQLLTFAYDMREYQFTDVPEWVKSTRYDISFTPDKPEITPNPGMPRDQMEGMFNRQRQRAQAVLRDRFGLVLRAEQKEMPAYSLLQAKGGHKLKAAEAASRGPHMRMSRNQISANGAYMKMLTDSLSQLLGRYVRNDTGLDGPFDFDLQFTAEAGRMPGLPPRPDEPPPPAAGGSSIFTALTEQLGLKLESKKAMVPVFTIAKIEKPSEN